MAKSGLTPAELIHEAEYRRCRGQSPSDMEACMYWMQTHVYIQHPEFGAIKFDLRDAQKSTLRDWMGNRMSIALKARQVGFSTLVMAYGLWLVLFWPDKFIIALSRTERDAAKLLRKAKYAYDRLPAWMRDRGPTRITNTQSKIEFDNGSAIESLPATDPARGESAYLIVVDEWAFFEDAEGAWSAIEPATDIGGRLIALSTANGSGNLFHQMVVGAQTGSNDMCFIFHSWRAVPERDAAWYESKKRAMLPHLLHQEYPTTPEEAFIKSGNPVFDVDMLLSKPTMPPKHRGYLERITGPADEFFARTTELRPAENGPLQVWEMPKVGTAYVIGADIAEGLEHGDYSVAWVINTRTGVCAAKWRGHIEPDLFGQILWDLGWFYGCALVGPESNNMGIVTCNTLRDMGYPNLYWRTTYDERTLKQSRKIGWRTSVSTKPLMIGELSSALRPEAVDAESDANESLADLVIWDQETIGELLTYVRDEKGKMGGSPFDDQVIALAVANQMRKHAATPEYQRDENDYLTFQWAMREIHERDIHDKTWHVGARNVRR